VLLKIPQLVLVLVIPLRNHRWCVCWSVCLSAATSTINAEKNIRRERIYWIISTEILLI
jgi:hypothetical protein